MFAPATAITHLWRVNREPATQASIQVRRPRALYGTFLLFSTVLLFAPLRSGDLAGYDDAHFAHIAKDIVVTGDWMNLRSNGAHVLEHPPLFVWMQAALFRAFHLSDALARLPSALCGWGVILLVYGLASRVLNGSAAPLLAMFVMATSIYFLKYAARAMTDVPFTFLCLCALYAWLRREEDARACAIAGAFAGLAQLTRGLMGIALPVVFAIDLALHPPRPPRRYVALAFALAFVPLIAWYAEIIYANRGHFWEDYSAWLDREAFGALSPPWRRYTGIFEYAWMLSKSYWPWLPFMLSGLVAGVRAGDRRLRLLILWTAVVYVLCAAAKSRVLRYLLPAYPVFAVFAAMSLAKRIPPRWLSASLSAAAAMLAVLAAGVALFPRNSSHAAEIRPIAAAATAATPPGVRVAFYDSGQPRLDEANQLQWYGDRYLDIMTKPEQLSRELSAPGPRTYVVDRETYQRRFASLPHRVLADSGHLLCLRLLQ
ncbi:MAG TPA: glycosyltransferase family 39 protein [Bryobacteraceae bacterium]|nr:glycosyltransferase family 39 protein [Bryobacteraceae bacterium]